MSKKTYVHTPLLVQCFDYDCASPKCRNYVCHDIDISICAIYQECSAFYYVFKSIESTLKNSGIAKNGSSEKLPNLLSIPYIVNGAFLCELSLKTILIENDIEFDLNKGHCLEYLFYLLPQDIRTYLTHKLKAESGLCSDEIADAIHHYSNAFVQWRYYFSNLEDNISYTNFFSILVHNLYAYINITGDSHK